MLETHLPSTLSSDDVPPRPRPQDELDQGEPLALEPQNLNEVALDLLVAPSARQHLHEMDVRAGREVGVQARDEGTCIPAFGLIVFGLGGRGFRVDRDAPHVLGQVADGIDAQQGMEGRPRGALEQDVLVPFC